MYTLRQNRWMALLIGVLLVCFSAICMLLQNEQMHKMQYNDSTNQLGAVTYSKNNKAGASPQHLSIQGANHPLTAENSVQLLNVNLLKKWNVKHHPLFVEGISAQSPAPAKKAQAVQAKPKAKKAVAVAAKPKLDPKLNPPTTLFFSRTKLLSPSQKSEATKQYKVTAEDVLLLRRIVMAEAEGEPYKGKVAVANVVLNRLRSANFPDTIRKVIYQRYQFSPVANGRFDRVKPNEDSIHAVNEALNGRKEVSDDTYYFLSLKLADDLTVHHTRTLAKTIGNHSFYK
ncbi:cell wall hydrolase [Paenibacillus cineris]|uniref:cell wall hydrolase n=1 Tax=Paenibacillus cineris TaxID=237530 RepID=UPI001B281196|nr:cell wall hydrolase [Paenibacillus cineris]GIO63406.1 hypothetical protein J43TS9_49800 [Paenibacillus cineris]